MADISLTVNSRVFTFAEGEVKKISSTINANLETTAISGYGPSAAYGFDYEGAIKTINITGILFATGTSRVAGYSIDTIIEQKQWLESLVNGSQGLITFTSNYETLSVLTTIGATAPYQSSFSNTTVKVANISFDEFEGAVNELAFSMTLEVCR